MMQMMKNEYYIDEYCESRGLKPSTRRSLGYVLNHYSDFQGLTLHELLEEADDEEEQGIRWKRRTLKHRLIAYMNHCKQTMSLGGAKTYFGKVKGFYTHHEIEIGQLPRWNTKNANITSPILPEDLPTKSIIRQAIEISNPLMRAIITTLISTGLARADLLRLTVDDLLSNTYEHHQKSTIQEALPILSKSDDIICTLKGRRYKNNKPYITFLTPEAITEICNYLLIRDKRNHKYHRPLLQPTDPLFKISPTTYGDKFVEINNTLKLGTRGTYNRFRGHMLRKYHATTLEKDGMSREHIRILQGKANSKVDEAYFYTDTETLRNEFIQHMDGLLIFTETKKIDQYSPEYAELKKQNKILLEKEKQINKIWDKLNNIENRQNIWEEMKQ
jgi:integrase